jgi:lysophospholipase L1-like esterase
MKFIIPFLLLFATSAQAQIRVACVGDSITFGARIPDRETQSYPAQLDALLGGEYEVKNFGVNGRTMLRKGNAPYWEHAAYKASQAFAPNMVIIKLGTNDSKEMNWVHKGAFKQDALDLVKSYQDLSSKPRVILCLPVPVVKDGGITQKIVRNGVAPILRAVALETGVELVDLHPVLIEHKDMFPDGLHPDARGAGRMAEYLYGIITTKFDPSFTFAKPEGASEGSYHGFRQYDFKHNDIACRVAVPKVSAKGVPWVWRGYYWGHQPQFDIAMLERGWHVVYCSVANMFGSPEAVERWNGFYDHLQPLGFGAKPVLEGMSRGGMIIHNFAIAHPDKVGGVIGDNAVMDLRSWPGDFNKPDQGHAPLWNDVLKVYGFADDAEARAYTKYPIDQLDVLKNAKVPLMYLVGDNDPVVPADANGLLAEKRLGDYATVIRKKGYGHHPHSLPDPGPIVDFALKCHERSMDNAAKVVPSSE